MFHLKIYDYVSGFMLFVWSLLFISIGEANPGGDRQKQSTL